jgi:hypothetical protein
VALTLADIADLRAYERERPEFLRRVMALKSRRRISVGPILTFLFENWETVRFQVQEMARVEKLITDAAIQTELDVYNTLIPAPGRLSATLFVELTSDEALRTWLPKLVGIETAPRLVLADGRSIAARTEEQHAGQLTDGATTASVHYVRFDLSDDEVVGFRSGPVRLRVDHPAYRHEVPLPAATHVELLADLVGSERHGEVEGS